MYSCVDQLQNSIPDCLANVVNVIITMCVFMHLWNLQGDILEIQCSCSESLWECTQHMSPSTCQGAVVQHCAYA